MEINIEKTKIMIINDIKKKRLLCSNTDLVLGKILDKCIYRVLLYTHSRGCQTRTSRKKKETRGKLLKRGYKRERRGFNDQMELITTR